MKRLERIYPHAIAVLGFILISLIYFYPVLQGKKIAQSDIAQYTGMAKEQIDFRASENSEPYWTNSAFGGMPTYQLGANYPHEYINKIDSALRILPRPADYLLLYFLGFYVLLLVLKADPLKAFFGALAFGFSTYLIIILGVGHNSKAHAIAYMPLVVAGVLLVFQRRFLVGGLLTMFAAALELNANHPQMTYYLLFLILIITFYYSYKYIKDKEYKSLFTAFGIFVIAGILAIGANATSLLATAEYAKYSTRGKSELTFSPDGSKSTSDNAMSHDYITEYSYGIAESFNLISPRIFGGSNGENIGTNTNMYEFLIGKSVPEEQAKEFVSSMPAYWGDQPIVAAPAYIGAVVFFLCLVALFLDKRKIKYVFVAGTVVSLILSWGKNFPILTDFFIVTIPMYNKFRAVSSIQVILELCIPVLAIMGLQSFFKEEKAQQLKGLYLSGGVFFGIIAFLIAIKSQFSFSGGSDTYYLENYGSEFINALKEDRKSLYSADLLRSGFLVLLAFGLLWFFVKNKISKSTAVILVGIIMISDLFFIDKNYVNAKSFVSPSEVDVPFQPTASDIEILRDTSHYRVFEVDGNMSSARASYFHQSIGGYSAVKPRRMQQLFDYQIAKNNMEVLNMLNTKFIIQTDKEGKEFPTYNPNHNGNAWFVQKVKFVNSPDQEMKALDSIDSKNSALVNEYEFGPFFKGDLTSFNVDSTATIQLLSYEPNHLKYVSNNSNPGVAVFSEMYYADGWNATIDGKSASHFRADYALRAMKIPAGKHSIEFKFEPQVVKTGSTIALISFILMILLLGAAIYLEQKKAKQ
ncbi:MAG: YfhO family protein [Flavobacterium sp.]|nr:YfhO family protein [Flavobacterium sp.]